MFWPMRPCGTFTQFWLAHAFLGIPLVISKEHKESILELCRVRLRRGEVPGPPVLTRHSPNRSSLLPDAPPPKSSQDNVRGMPLVREANRMLGMGGTMGVSDASGYEGSHYNIPQAVHCASECISCLLSACSGVPSGSVAYLHLAPPLWRCDVLELEWTGRRAAGWMWIVGGRHLSAYPRDAALTRACFDALRAIAHQYGSNAGGYEQNDGEIYIFAGTPSHWCTPDAGVVHAPPGPRCGWARTGRWTR
ncbi:hypothetical protein B0H14DRAFT_2598573 [Mycena olivaceomarginata]|nr:hypothetical protein B0H14DRAFT_2598573 [Mycena olivaceomarginata]